MPHRLEADVYAALAQEGLHVNERQRVSGLISSAVSQLIRTSQDRSIQLND
jgi:hypothetical protein